MAPPQHVTFESSGSSESDSDSDFSSASLCKTSPVEKSVPSTEPLKGRKCKCESSGNDNDNKTKSSKRLRQKKDNEESSYPEHTQDPKEIHLNAVHQVVITTIHATDLTLGLRRIPAGFRVVIKTDSAECQTSNNPVHVDQAVIKWTEPILLYVVPNLIFPARIEKDPRPCNLSSKVQVSIDHPDQTITQLHLAIALQSHFAKQGFPTDADAARELLSKVLNICHANSHIHRAALIAIETSALYSAESINANDLGQEWPAAPMLPLSPNQLAHQVEWCLQKDDPCALDEVISLHYDALAYYNTGHNDRGQLLGNLGIMLQTHFNHQSNGEDLDQAIAHQMEVLALRPVSHTDWSASLNNLATQLSCRFEHQGNEEDLDWAITLHREVLALRLVGHPDRSSSLNNLAFQLSARFEHQGNDEDLDQGITPQREVLALLPVSHTDRSKSLNNLVNQLFSHCPLT
ncbi:hypothetical protein F4604DRAFT_1938670 [Suillus subluteus]|nr:hypothetical protein F4604DRAFT_1938670 [Suillus subluteus]